MSPFSAAGWPASIHSCLGWLMFLLTIVPPALATRPTGKTLVFSLPMIMAALQEEVGAASCA